MLLKIALVTFELFYDTSQTSVVTLNTNKKYYIEIVGEFNGFHELLYAVVSPGIGSSLKAVTTNMLSGIRIGIKF